MTLILSLLKLHKIMVKINGSSFALQYKRTTGRPIDSTETFKTLEDATSYARNTDAEEYFPYAGQIISVEIGEGVYKLVKDDSISEEDGRKHYRLSPIITEEESGNKYLSKIEDDEARGLITFLAGINVKIKAVIQKLIAEDATFSKEISSKDYVQNLLGWMITPEGHIDAKSLRLRDFLEVPELRYNRVSIVSGEEWNAPGGGIIESVDAVNKTVHLKLEPGEVSQVEIDDICKGVFNNDTGFQTAYFRITEKIDNASYKYVLRSGYTFNPCKAMHFVAYGNFTNAERQKSCYSTQNYIRFLKGVNNWEITKDMIAMQLGDLSNLKLFGIDMSGHSAYLNRVYMTGTIRQISSDGVTEAPVPVFKGKWKSGTYWYYDEVTHNGSTWICIESTTTQEPSDSSTDWLKVVSEGRPGDDGTSLVFKGEFASAPSNPHNGWYYRNTTDKKCYVYQDGAWHLMTEDGKPGADGAGSISAILDDGMQSVSCNSSGAVISGLPLTTTFSMYYGTTKLALDSLTVGSITGVTSSANKSTGVVTVSAITAAASDTIRIPVTGKASYKDAQYERTVYLSVNKVKPGSDGENAIIYSLQPSVNVIKKNADGSSEVSKISCRIMKTDGASTVVSSLPAGYSMDYVIDSGTANGYTPGSDVAVSGITTKIQFRLYSETSGVVLVDQQTIVVLKDGSNGKPGDDGVGIKDVDVLFYLSSSATSLIGGSWSTTSPTWQNGKYLWSKTKVTYTDDSTWESDPVCITGSQGQTGLPGAMLRPRGVWAANTEYYHNDAFIDTVIYNGQNKLCKITHTSTSSFDSTKWEEFSEFVNVATNVLLAQNATIDVLGTSGIFVGNLEKTEGWLMTEGSIKHNQTGVELTADGKISLPESGGMTVGGKTFIEAGKIKTEFINVDTLEVTKLKGATGTFKELQAIDNAGKIQGKISFNTEGSGDNVSSSFNIDFSKTWISGDLYQQGYNSEEGRSWRFYTSDLWCRGEFGHRVMTTIKVFANNDWNFYVHIYGYGSDNNVDRYPQSGQPIDCIVMEGNGNYVLRICDSATFKKVTVVNSSDYPKRVVYNQPSSLTYTIEPWKFVTFVTADIAKTSPPYYVNNLFIK